jgi:hypothetical protein
MISQSWRSKSLFEFNFGRMVTVENIHIIPFFFFKKKGDCSKFKCGLGPTQPPILWVPGALSLGVKQLGREADHSLLSSAEVNDAWSYTSTPPIHLYGMVLS